MGSGRRAKQQRRARSQSRDLDTLRLFTAGPLAAEVRDFRGGLCELERLVIADPTTFVTHVNARCLARAASYATQPHLLSSFGWRVGYAIAAADVVLERHGAPWFRADTGVSIEDRWLGGLRDALDTFARICWHLRFGYTLAATALTRRYIERWTYNLAFSTETPRLEGEDDVAYIERVWSTYSHMADRGEVASNWASLSELLHGRTVEIAGTPLNVDASMTDAARARVHNYIVRAAEIPLRQVRGLIASYVQDRGDADPASHAALQAQVADLPRPVDPPEFLEAFMEPLDFPFVVSADAERYSTWGEKYRRTIARRATQPLVLHPFDSWISIEERWTRAIDEARRAFELEAIQRHNQFATVNVTATLLQYQVITEMTHLVADEEKGVERDSLRSAASALESSWILWLQDVDESLTCMRTVLESVARARTHRIKPGQADKLEQRGRRTTPQRWVEAAGWRRLSPFVRALGEFAHQQERSRHTAARELLTVIQREPEGDGAHTARANALFEVAMMLGHEIGTRLETVSPRLAEEFRTRILDESTPEALEQDLANWLNHALRFKGHDFGAVEPERSVSETEQSTGTVSMP